MSGTRTHNTFNFRSLVSSRKYGATLRTLCLRRVCYSTCDDLTRFLEAFPALMDLRCERITFGKPGNLFRRIDVGIAKEAVDMLLETHARVDALEEIILDVMNISPDNAGRFITFISQLPRVRCLTLSLRLGRDDKEMLRGLSHMLQVLRELFNSSVLTSTSPGVVVQLVTAAPGHFDHALSKADAIQIRRELEGQLLRIPLQRMILYVWNIKANREQFWISELEHDFPRLRPSGLLMSRADRVFTNIGHDDIVSTFTVSPDSK
ncbi:hypothetical protein DICSQDRAFT_167081 [Dichomitus squalens LYAD-421 SS1]|uniref:uncharacterized protein n=1 Tax=Dichomitus squalens (strain LYAD-421) TaxID=732165 RepID=UPI0004412384|nr:uncharacterized protein DICSQDRAFT_167081 [Dichomitus squalens LYAD-421 SS1]EJF64935.1 hypothetical protein DICSQDRAFT_167081 [Dichomitus squalens LYAD-421 SS1]